MVRAVMPCLRALSLARALFATVLGPVLFYALRRLPSICAGVAMGVNSLVGSTMVKTEGVEPRRSERAPRKTRGESL